MHALTPAGTALIATPAPAMLLFVSMAFSTPVNLCSFNADVTVGGVTYKGAAGIGRISAVQTTYSEIRQLQFELSGASSTLVSLALGGGVQGTPVTISVGLFDTSSLSVTDLVPIWGGQLDTMKLVDGSPTATLQVTAEHVGIDLNRPAPLYYSDADQQTLHPGDLFFQYTSQQFDQQIVWPGSAYFRK